jgi:hypothetical protein
MLCSDRQVHILKAARLFMAKTYGRPPHTATHPTFETTNGFAFETFEEMMAHLKLCNGWMTPSTHDYDDLSS